MAVRNLPTDQCPRYRGEAAQKYVMHWMVQSEARVFEQHMKHCPACVQSVSELQVYAGLLRVALSEAVAR
jgi:hypothetical protein